MMPAPAVRGWLVVVSSLWASAASRLVPQADLLVVEQVTAQATVGLPWLIGKQGVDAWRRRVYTTDVAPVTYSDRTSRGVHMFGHLARPPGRLAFASFSMTPTAVPRYPGRA
jgi:hypothetical protein